MTERPPEEILAEALEMNPPERRAYIDRVCRNRPTLRAEVESLLAIHDRYPDLLQTPPMLEVLPPGTIGSYRVIGERARGGMGVVYEAQDPELKRRIALKLLPDYLARSGAWRERFQREAQLLASMNHPNIATVHSLEESDGQLFLTMELLPERTLADAIESGSIDLARGLGLCRQIATALEAVHAHGIVHCDLKPSNVMLSADDAVKVIDFGLARREEHRMGEVRYGNDASSSDPVTGTPGYMSPEQIVGVQPDARTDIWSFGCILFECLSGHRAFPGPTKQERIERTLRRDPDWSRVPPATPAAVRDLLQQCLQKNPADRIRSAAEARGVLDQHILLLSLRRRSPAGDFGGAGNLPATLDRFIGRTAERRALVDMVRNRRLVTVTGAGGCGKSRLAVEVAREECASTGIEGWRLDLSSVGSAEQLVPALAATLQLGGEPGGDLLDALLDQLRDRALLILWDGCEHLIASSGRLIETVLDRCPGVRILATSRQPLGVAGEALLPLEPLHVPAPDRASDVEATRGVESVQLFVARAQDVQSDFDLTTSNAPAVAEICRRLDGLPLALELAARKVRVLKPAEIARRLDDRFRLLREPGRGAVSTHQTLVGLLDWSYGLLTEKERLLLRRVSIFSGGWGLADAEAVCSGAGIEPWEILDLTSALRDKSLIEVDLGDASSDGGARYRMLETIGVFTRERLREQGESDALGAAHLGHFLRIAEEEAPRLKGPQQAQALARLATQHDNLLRALQTATEPGIDPQLGLRLVAALERYWMARGHWSEGRRWTDTMLARDPSDAVTAPRGHALNAAGNWRLYAGDLDSAAARYREALAIGRALEDHDIITRSLHNHGGVALHKGDLPRARAFFEEYLELERESPNQAGVAMVMSNLGLVAERAGDRARARDFYTRSLAISRRLEDRRMIAILSNNLGAVDLVEGRLEEARARFEESLELVRELGDRWNAAHALHHLGMIAGQQQDLMEAEERFHESLTIYRELGDQPAVARLITQFAILAGLREQWCEAVERFAAAESIREQLEAPLPPNHRREVDEHIAAVRAHLAPEVFDRVWRQGSGLSLDEAIAKVLRFSGR